MTLHKFFPDYEPTVNSNLPRYDKARVAFQNQLASCEMRVTSQFQGRDIELTVESPRQIAKESIELQITFDAGDSVCHCYLDTNVLQTLCEACGYAINFQELDLTAQSYILELILQPGIEEIQNILGVEVLFRDILTTVFNGDRDRGIAFCARISDLDKANVQIELVADLRTMTKLLGELPTTVISKNDVKSLSLKASLQTHGCLVAMRELRECQTGDVVMIPSQVLDGHEYQLIAGYRRIGMAKIEEDSIVLTSDVGIHENPKLDRIPNTMKAQTQPSTLGDLEILLSVEIDRIDVKISELEDMHAGSVLKLDSDRPDEVVLYASGQAFASGALVQLDGSLGVQITKVL